MAGRRLALPRHSRFRVTAVPELKSGVDTEVGSWVRAAADAATANEREDVPKRRTDAERERK